MANTYNEVGFTYNDSGSTYNTLGASALPAWPTGPITLRTDLQLNGVWTNITSDVYTAERVVINRGRQDEAAAPQASSCTLTVNNRSGKYTPKNPAGAYYGQLQRGTPIRIGIGTPPNGTSTNGSASTTMTAPAVNAEASGVALSCWAQQSNTSSFTPPAGYTAASTQHGASVLGSSSFAAYKTVSAGPVAAAAATSSVSALWAAASVVIPGGGAPVSTTQIGATFYFYATGFGAVALTPSAVSVNAGDVLVAFITWGADPRGAMISAPADQSLSAEWTLVADSGASAGPRVQAWARYCPIADSFRIQAAGECYGANDTQMTVYRVVGAASWNPRYTGACVDFSTTADLSGNDIRTTITCGQVLRQRGQGQQATQSSTYRYILDRTPLAYWPLETGSLGGVFNSPIAGVAPVQPYFTTSGADSTSFAPYSDSLPQIAANGEIVCTIPTYTASANQSGCLFFMCNVTGTPTLVSTLATIKFANDGTTATTSAFEIVMNSATDVVLVSLDGTGHVTNSATVFIPTQVAGSGGTMTGTPLGVWVFWNPSPSLPSTTTDVSIMLSTAGFSGAANGMSPTLKTGRATQILLGVDAQISTPIGTPTTYGHVTFDPFNVNAASVQQPQSVVFPSQASQNLVGGFAKEQVGLRMRRICQDESIYLYMPVFVDEANDIRSVRHGMQLIDNGLGLINTTQTTDGGELTEPRGFNGLLYWPLGALGSRAVAQTLDYNAKMVTEPFEPTDDDQLIRNDITVTQDSGSSARAALLSGALSTAQPPLGVGTYTSSLSVNAADQTTDLQQIANWALALGTYDAQRFKQVLTQIQVVPASATGLSLMDIGNHVEISNTPAWIQPGPSGIIVIGLQEVIGSVAEWEITTTGRPYGPFNVTRMDGGDKFARLDSGSSTLSTGYSAGATSLSVATSNAGDLWSTAAAPFDILVAGERMTVTAVSGSSSPQTFTVVRAVNGVSKAQASGTAVHLYYGTYLGLSSDQ